MNRKDRRLAAASGRKGISVAIPQQAYEDYVRGYNCHAKGDFEGAKSFYLRAAAMAPFYGGVLLGLGLLALKDGLLDEAEDLLRRAHKAEPKDPNILANLAAALLQGKKFKECVAASNKALKLDPKNVEALINLCQAQRDLKLIDEAVVTAERAVAAGPNNGMAHRTLAHVLLLKPGYILSRFDDIVDHVGKARKIDNEPDGTLDLVLADLLLERGRFNEVVEIVREKTGDVTDPVFCRIACQALFSMQKYDLSLKFSKRRCELEPDDPKAHEQHAKVLSNLHRYDEALVHLERCVELDPEQHKARLDICHMKQLLCAWTGLEELQQDVIRVMGETKSFTGPFHLLSIPEPAGSPENQLLAGQLYHGRVDMTGVVKHERHKRQATNKRIKIGYLSNDLRDHATAFLISELIERHDRHRFEISAYCYTMHDGSNFQKRLRLAFDRFVDVNPMSIEQTAHKIQADQIDILVDLKGFTQGSRTNVLAYRPAPIQVNYLGFPGTLGSPSVDYIIGDEFLTPFESAAYYAEKIVQLPNCYQPNDSKRALSNYLMRRQDFGLPEDAFVFASFNNPNKLTPEMFRLWARLLHAVPNSVLWVYATSPAIRLNLKAEAKALGLGEDRLVFAGFADVGTHIARLRMADLFLDCFPCTAHTTASEALWAGLPLLTCAGRTFASRVAGSILKAARLPELITESLEEYEALALELARNPQRLKSIRARAGRASSTPLFDIETYTRDLERAYEHMAEIYNSGEDPQPFAVRDLQPKEINSSSNREIEPVTSSALKLVGDDDAQELLPNARVPYEGCPLCFEQNIVPVGPSDCTNHMLYKSNLPTHIDWQLCSDCKHVFASGFFGEEALAVLYPSLPPAEKVGHDLEHKRVTASKTVQHVARFAKPGRWLDVGFGDASLLFTAAEWGFPVTGLDIRSENVTLLRNLGYDAHDQCIELYEPADKFSVISMVNLLQHVPFPGSAIEKASNLLNPGGLLFITVPNMDTVIWRILDELRKNTFWSDLETYHHFTRKRLYDLLIMNGLLPLEYNVNSQHRSSMDVLAIKPAD